MNKGSCASLALRQFRQTGLRAIWLRLASCILACGAAQPILAEDTTFLNCVGSAAELKTNEVIEVDPFDGQIVIKGANVINGDELCAGDGTFQSAVTEYDIFVQCARGDTSRELKISRLTGEFEVLSRSLKDPEVYITYVGACDEVEPRF